MMPMLTKTMFLINLWIMGMRIMRAMMGKMGKMGTMGMTRVAVYLQLSSTLNPY
jgi:hypothetical protein